MAHLYHCWCGKTSRCDKTHRFNEIYVEKCQCPDHYPERALSSKELRHALEGKSSLSAEQIARFEEDYQQEVRKGSERWSDAPASITPTVPQTWLVLYPWNGKPPGTT